MLQLIYTKNHTNHIIFTAWRGKAWQGEARLGMAWHGKAWQGEARKLLKNYKGEK